MGYFSQYALETDLDIVDHSYPTRREILRYYLEDLTNALEKSDGLRPRNRMDPSFDRYFYSNGQYRYDSVLWAPEITVEDLLSAVAEVQYLLQSLELDKHDPAGAASIEDASPLPGQVTLISFWTPLLVSRRHAMDGGVGA